ncbi:Protein CBG26168 [Caenorhabditis briggsae]|nr:Protein CBG26168 [Caenorhabditis briggsae]CAS00684.1 Protein CBG26168 [Caenorhabditis briggsae]
MPLFPILAGYCEGFLAKYLGIWSHYLIGLQLSSMIFQVECLVFCFAIKHQNIGRVINYNVVSDDYYFVGIVLFIISPIGAFIVFVQSGMKREDQMAHIVSKCPEFINQFSTLSNFAIYEFNIWSLFLAGGACLGALVCGAAFTLITMDIFRMLKTLQKKVSATSFKKYQNAVKSLLVQFATSGLLLVPLSGFVLFTLFTFERAQVFVEITLLIGALHPIVNAIVLTMTTSQFRDVLFG